MEKGVLVSEKLYACIYSAQTENGILLSKVTWDDDDARWFPKSQLDWNENAKLKDFVDLEPGDDIEVWIPDWLARKNDFME